MSGRLQRWEIVLIALAILKVILAVALVGFTLGTQSERIEPRHALLFAHVAVFGAAATMLLWGGRRDARAALLGSTFMLTAAVFGDNALALSRSLPGSVTAAIRVVFAIQVDAFTAYFLWRFVSAFPGVDRIGARYALPRLACQVALLVGVALFAINLLYAFGRLNESWPALYDALTPLARKSSRQATWYWITQYALTLPALPALAWEARGMTAHERRRVSLLIAGLVVGLAPTILWVLATSISPQIGRGFKYAAWVIYPALLSTPLTTAYAVIVQQALDTRLVVRRAVQYALARYTLVAAAAIPALLLAMGIYKVRDRSVKELATLSNSALVLVLILATTVVGRRRRGAIEALDRRFFREQYDARRILGDLVERCRNATGRSELAEVMSGEIDRALHLSSVSVLFRDRSGGSLTSTRLGVRPLEASSKIVRHLSESNAALDVDVERPTSFIAALPDSDLHWLTDTGTRLLVPLKDKEGQLTGLMSLGEKKSELPFSQEDRLLLNAVASAAALTLAYLGVQSHDTDGQHAAVVAEGSGGAECVACGLLDDSTAQRCGRCGSELSQSLIPGLLGKKFRVIERVGVGGMGVVYRALDIELGRQVALKTLPRVAPSRAARLRREARTIAAVSHPNLALIYGTESWNGIPILVFEFLGGGTLATRIASGGMNVSEALEIGMTLADVVGTLHRAGIVHRDIKPSNIGFTTDGTLKLLDFGVARLLSEPLQHAGSDGRPPVRPAPNVQDGTEGSATATASDQHVVGTPLYLSPEALAGREPEPSFDIWGICIVLYEAIAGTHPARDTSINKSLLRIESAAFPDIRSFTPSANAALAEFFRRALSVNAAERPRSARALREDLARLAASGYSPRQTASVA